MLAVMLQNIIKVQLSSCKFKYLVKRDLVGYSSQISVNESAISLSEFPPPQKPSLIYCEFGSSRVFSACVLISKEREGDVTVSIANLKRLSQRPSTNPLVHQGEAFSVWWGTSRASTAEAKAG